MVIVFRGAKFKNLHINSEHYNNVIVQNINTDHKYSDIHRAVMSTSFCDEIIREFTQKNDVVFDPFMGLGTTGISCVRQDRAFVGCEIYEPYYWIAYDRMVIESCQTSIFDLENSDDYSSHNYVELNQYNLFE